MAEVGIGVASGVLTFATVIVQIGKSIYTIKNFWDDFQDAPHDLQMLVRELKAYGIVLESIKKDLSQPSFCSALEHNSHASEIFDLCTNAAEGLDLVCKDLSQEPTSSSSRLSRLRKPLRLVRSKAKIEKHKARLQNAIQWLMLSQQFYIM